MQLLGLFLCVRPLTSTLATRTSSRLSGGRLTREAAGSTNYGFGDALSQNLLPAHHLGDRWAALGNQNLPTADGHLFDSGLKCGGDGDTQHLQGERQALWSARLSASVCRAESCRSAETATLLAVVAAAAPACFWADMEIM